MKNTTKNTLGALGLFALMAVTPTAAQADVSDGWYELGNHADVELTCSAEWSVATVVLIPEGKSVSATSYVADASVTSRGVRFVYGTEALTLAFTPLGEIQPSETYTFPADCWESKGTPHEQPPLDETDGLLIPAIHVDVPVRLAGLNRAV